MVYLVEIYPANRRGFVVGLWEASIGVGIAVGPILGGGLLSAFGWRLSAEGSGGSDALPGPVADGRRPAAPSQSRALASSVAKSFLPTPAGPVKR